MILRVSSKIRSPSLSIGSDPGIEGWIINDESHIPGLLKSCENYANPSRQKEYAEFFVDIFGKSRWALA
jgi:hypothetical protein